MAMKPNRSLIDMFSYKVVLFSLIAVTATCDEDLDFPPGFMFGVASAAYQVEGGWNASDKGESIWDRFIQEQPHSIANLSTAHVACDSYHLWRRDIEMCSELGLDFYRMSISWPRLLPEGFANKISQDGLNYYNNLIDGLLKKGIQPMVTLYHWDLPQNLQDLGGWINPMMVDWFGDYARVVFSHFADRVRMWITLNEPIITCDMYCCGAGAPGVKSPDVAPYICNKNVLLAHAKAYRIFDEEFRPKYYGEISIANSFMWYEPLSTEYEEMTEIARQFSGGRYSHAIYSKEGGWPPGVEELLAKTCKEKGYAKSCLPPFTKEEVEFVRGTFDYYANNYYTTRLIRKAKKGEYLHPFNDAPDLDAKFEVHPDWQSGSSSWIYMYPQGLRNQLLWLRKQYGDIKFVITENGSPSLNGLDDIDRIKYYKEHLKQILVGIKEDGLNITGYTAWALMDCFEWMDGYNSKFGFYQVNFSSPELTRTPKASARFYKNLIARHSLNDTEYV